MSREKVIAELKRWVEEQGRQAGEAMSVAAEEMGMEDEKRLEEFRRERKSIRTVRSVRSQT